MDIQMPVMDGTEATHIIRNLKSEIRNVPIIAMTADAMEGDREKYIRQGMDDYVAKPVNPEELLAAIQRQVKQKTESGGQRTEHKRQVFDKTDFLNRIGDETLGKEFIKMFLSDMPEKLNSLKSSIEAGDLKSAAAYSHTLKGTFGNISAYRLYDNALEMEIAVKQNEPEKVRELVIRMEKEFTRLKSVLGVLSTKPRNFREALSPSVTY